jgi:heme exporter protein D
MSWSGALVIQAGAPTARSSDGHFWFWLSFVILNVFQYIFLSSLKHKRDIGHQLHQQYETQAHLDEERKKKTSFSFVTDIHNAITRSA